jgi:hypothetical protein
MNSPPPRPGLCHFLQHVLHADQLIVEDLLRDVEKLEYRRVADGIIDIQTLLAPDDDVPASQDRQLLRQGALLHIEPLAKLVNAELTVPQRINDCNPERVSQGLEEFRFEYPQL